MSALLVLLLQAVAMAVEPAAPRTFSDWTVGCDNQRACHALALPREGADRGTALLLAVRRDGAAAAPARLEVPLPAAVPPGAKLSLTVDGKVLAQLIAPGGSGGLALPFEGALVAALVNGREMSLTYGDGRALATASLAGIGATLGSMDEAQERTGTREALRDPGRATMKLAVPTLPVIVQPPVTARRPRSITLRDAARLLDPTDVACAVTPITPRVFRLDAAHTLVTINHSCARDALNPPTSVFVMMERGAAAPARVDPLDQPYNAHRLPNGVWDTRRRRLVSYHRGSTADECGRMEEYAWDGERFRLTLRSEMPECRGAIGYITTWRANVTAR